MFDNPAAVIVRLAEIEQELAVRQNSYESAARNWVIAMREQKKARAIVFLNAEGTVAERSAQADKETALDGVQAEAEYEAIRAVVRTLESRATIGQSILRAQGRF